MLARWIAAVGIGLLVAGCSGASRPSPTPTVSDTGKLTGTVDGGCFGYLGPPNPWTVTVTASQNGVAKRSTTLSEIKSDASGGPYTMLYNRYHLTLPPGAYDMSASGVGLTENGHDAALGTVIVRAGRTTTNPSPMTPSCA